MSDKIDGNLTFRWGNVNYKSITNILKVSRGDRLIDLIYILNTPKFDEATLVAKMFYDSDDVYHKIK
jgi:hypothetical protein